MCVNLALIGDLHVFSFIETAMAHMPWLALKQVYYEEELYSTN